MGTVPRALLFWIQNITEIKQNVIQFWDTDSCNKFRKLRKKWGSWKRPDRDQEKKTHG